MVFTSGVVDAVWGDVDGQWSNGMSTASTRTPIMPPIVHGLPVGKQPHVICHQAAVQGFHSSQVGAMWPRRPIDPRRVQIVHHISLNVCSQ